MFNGLLILVPNVEVEISFDIWLFFAFWIFIDMSCFQGLFVCPDAASLLLNNFCVYHIDAPGHEVSIRNGFCLNNELFVQLLNTLSAGVFLIGRC